MVGDSCRKRAPPGYSIIGKRSSAPWKIKSIIIIREKRTVESREGERRFPARFKSLTSQICPR